MSLLVRTQLMLRSDQHADLTRLASETGRSISEVVRELVDAQLKAQRNERMRRAARELRADYEAGGSLAMHELDGEEFIDA